MYEKGQFPAIDSLFSDGRSVYNADGPVNNEMFEITEKSGYGSLP